VYADTNKLYCYVIHLQCKHFAQQAFYTASIMPLLGMSFSTSLFRNNYEQTSMASKISSLVRKKVRKRLLDLKSDLRWAVSKMRPGIASIVIRKHALKSHWFGCIIVCF